MQVNGHLVDEHYYLYDHYLRLEVTYWNNITQFSGRRDTYQIDLDNIEWYEDNTPKRFIGQYFDRKRMLIRYKNGDEFLYWMDIYEFRKKYVEYLLWYKK